MFFIICCGLLILQEFSSLVLPKKLYYNKTDNKFCYDSSWLYFHCSLVNINNCKIYDGIVYYHKTESAIFLDSTCIKNFFEDFEILKINNIDYRLKKKIIFIGNWDFYLLRVEII